MLGRYAVVKRQNRPKWALYVSTRDYLLFIAIATGKISMAKYAKLAR